MDTAVTEAQFQSKLIKLLKTHPLLKDAIIWKVSDRFGGGRPDLQIILNGETTYFELKVAPGWLSKLQEYYLKKIGRRAHLVTHFPNSGMTSVDAVYCSRITLAVEKMAALCL